MKFIHSWALQYENASVLKVLILSVIFAQIVSKNIIFNSYGKFIWNCYCNIAQSEIVIAMSISKVKMYLLGLFFHFCEMLWLKMFYVLIGKYIKSLTLLPKLSSMWKFCFVIIKNYFSGIVSCKKNNFILLISCNNTGKNQLYCNGRFMSTL